LVRRICLASLLDLRMLTAALTWRVSVVFFFSSYSPLRVNTSCSSLRVCTFFWVSFSFLFSSCRRFPSTLASVSKAYFLLRMLFCWRDLSMMSLLSLVMVLLFWRMTFSTSSMLCMASCCSRTVSSSFLILSNLYSRE